MGRQLARIAVVLVATLTLLVPVRAAAPPSGLRLPTEVAPQTVDTVVVEQGDHLWKISARHLLEHLGRKATSAEITPYWVEVIHENLDNLRSGDPDLVYPGEVVELPEVSELR